MSRLLCLLTLLLFVLRTAAATDFFVSASGSPAGDGSKGSPWDLQTAFNHPAAVQPGATIWLRGGTYFAASKVSPAGTFSNTVFVCKLNGASNAPIVVRQYPEERTTINGGIYGGGSWYWLWGFEIMNTDPLRDVPNQFARSWGVFLVGRGCRLINLVVHDCGHPGIGFWDGVGDSGEVTGCILWGNGFYDHSFNPVDIRGGGIYGQNQFGTRYVRDNIFFKQFTQGIHLYATATYVNGFQVDGNVFFNNGAGTFNLFLGTIETPMSGNGVFNNITYFNPGQNGTNIRLGYEALNNNAVTVKSNLVVNGTVGLYIGQTQTGTVTENSIFGATDRVVQLQRTGNFASFNFNWNSNHYITTVARPFIYADPVGLLSLTNWKANTGYDANSSFLAGSPAGVKVIVRPNPYELGRAHIVVLNWSAQSTVSVDISSAGLTLGDGFEIRDVQNLFGPPVLSGSYDGNPVTLPLTLAAVPPLVGTVTHINNAHTGRDFNTFLLVPTTPNNKVTLLSEGFEGVFPGSWTVGDANPDGTNSTWAAVDAAFGGEGAHSGQRKAYCAGTAYAGPPGQPAYLDSSAAFLQQDLNLRGFTNATLTFWHRIPSLQTCCDSLAVSVDGSPIWSSAATNTAWQQVALPLTPFLGGTHTLRFDFLSDTTETAEGWYLDDILVSGYLRTNKFIVATADDSGAGSLRQAILDANANFGGVITFNIAAGGPQVLQLNTPLPTLAAPIHLDARTQPGYAGVPLIQLDGGRVTGDGLIVTGQNCMVQGFAIRGFSGAGIVLRDGANNLIQRNYIGAEAAGNGSFGILIDNSSHNTLGGESASVGNVIAFNAAHGIRVLSGIDNRIQGNSISANGSLGISLEDAPSPNDPGDGDDGPNHLQNYPLLTYADSLGVLAGTLNSAANADFLLQFFANSACDPSGFGEGEVYLGSLPVSTDGDGNAAFTFSFTPAAGKLYLTATATDAGGSTSEFSPCQRLKEIPTVALAATTPLAAEPATPGRFTLSRNGTAESNLTVNVSIGGTASNGVDYVLMPGSITIPAGVFSTTIDVTPLDDDTAELPESILLTLLTNADYVIAQPANASIILIDDDAMPLLSIANASVSEGNNGTTLATFTVSLNQPIAQTVSVDFATSDSTALAGDDYLATAGTLTFPPGLTNLNLSVSILGDLTFEPDETFSVTLSNALHATIGVAQAIGTIRNDDLPPPPEPGAAAALQFDGIDDHVNAPDSPSLRITNTLTVEAWINRATNGVQHCIVEKYGCSGQGGYAMRVTAANKLLFGTRDDCNTGVSVTGATSLAANTWYHVAGVFDGAQLRVYVNGILDGTLASTRAPRPGNTPLRLGARGNDLGILFSGMIDEVRVWNVVRTPEELQSSMNHVLLSIEPGLAGYWRLDDGDGLTATDSSGNGNHATLTNGPIWVVATAPIAVLPAVTTDPATDLTQTTATLHGTIDTAGFVVTAYGQWGLTPSFGNLTPAETLGPGSNIVAVSQRLDQLLPGTTYYFRQVAVTVTAGTLYGATLSFHTPAPPDAATGPTTSITAEAATLNGTINAHGRPTIVFFEWSTTPDFVDAVATAPGDAGEATTNVAFSTMLTGLTPGATYYYHIAAVNDESASLGSDQSFTAAAAPQAAAEFADGVTFNSATLHAVVNPNGWPTLVRFEWGATVNYGNVTAPLSVDAGAGSTAMSQILSGLDYGTFYYFRVVATNNGGTATGAGSVFSTGLPPPPTPLFTAAPTSGVAPLTVSFSNSTAGITTGYNWDFGDGTTSASAQPVQTYTNAGDYTVTLTATGPGGSASISFSNHVHVRNPPPIAAFDAAPTAGPRPLSVTFNNRTLGLATNYAWDFGDTTTSAAVNPTKLYTNPGLYTVRLTASGPGGRTTNTQVNFITVTNPPPPPPAAGFTATPTSGAAPLTVAFTNRTTGAVTGYNWNFGDGTSSTATNLIKAYATAGLYTVTLGATGPGGIGTSTRTNYILVTNIPPPAVAFTADTTIGPAPLTVHFTNLTTGNATGYLWDFGSGATSSALQPTKTYSNAGSYTVALTATGPGGANTSVRSGYINVTLASIIRGYALKLDGTNDYVSVASKPPLKISGPITVEALIRRATTGAQHSILEKYDCSGTGGYALRVGADDRIHFASRITCTTETSAIGATRLQSNVWYHVAGVFDGSQIRVYVNGTLDGTLNTTLKPTPKDSPLKIGARGNDSATTFAGQIDEVRLWAVARTAADIRSHLFPCLAGTETGLVGYWRFDEGSGTSATDATGHGYTGALQNGALWAGSAVGCAQSQGAPFWRITADLKSNACHLAITGNPGALATIETSADLLRWSPLATFLNVAGSFELLDPRSPAVARSFYRVKQEP